MAYLKGSPPPKKKAVIRSVAFPATISGLFAWKKYSGKYFSLVLCMSHACMLPKLPCCHIHRLTEAPGIREVALVSQEGISLLTERLQVLQDGASLGSVIAFTRNSCLSLLDTC